MAGDPQPLEQATEILGARLKQKILMPEVAAKLGMGYESFRKKFTVRYGMSPQEYRIVCRLDKADALLLHTDLSIKEIADSLGFKSDSDFTRQYRQHRQQTPGMFRRSTYS